MSEIAPEIRQELASLKDEVHSLKVDLNDKIGKLDTEVRIVQHDYVQLKDMINGVGARVEKVEERISGKIDALAEKLAGVNMQQARGIGFFAGVSAVITIAGGLLLALGKILFGAP